MKPTRSIEVLLVGTELEGPRLESLAQGLRRRGHRASLATGKQQALGQPTPTVLILTEAIGSELFAGFSRPGGLPRCLFLAEGRDFDVAARATRHGAHELLCEPTLDALLAAVERQAECSHERTTASRCLELHASAERSGRALLDLLAFTTRIGVGRSLRMRIATAVSELLAASRTGAADAEPLTLSARLTDDPLGIDRLVVELIGLSSEGTPEEQPSAFDFARALADRLDLEQHHGLCTARAEFLLAPAHFEEDPAGLDELDYFDPDCLRELHAVLGDPEERFGADLHHLAPAAAPTLGRILAAGRSPEAALLASSAEPSIQS